MNTCPSNYRFLFLILNFIIIIATYSNRLNIFQISRPTNPRVRNPARHVSFAYNYTQVGDIEIDYKAKF
nr:hypothetical protein [Candidatus Levybacteria bacterium]